jgi:hypothetical protein
VLSKAAARRTRRALAGAFGGWRGAVVAAGTEGRLKRLDDVEVRRRGAVQQAT